VKTHSVPPASSRRKGGVINFLIGNFYPNSAILKSRAHHPAKRMGPCLKLLGAAANLLMMCMFRAWAAAQILGTSPDLDWRFCEGIFFSVAGGRVRVLIRLCRAPYLCFFIAEHPHAATCPSSSRRGNPFVSSRNLFANIMSFSYLA
jgi:hypothetical protein